MVGTRLQYHQYIRKPRLAGIFRSGFRKLVVDFEYNLMENLKYSLLLVFGTVNGQLMEPRPQRPLCASQIALVNYACGRTPEENCCRWLNDVDAECVCELLVHLPPFLSKPPHEYTVKIDDSCTVSYSCGLIK
uniref:Uncharacterized protein n=1 Tax=Salix viminalis TaxID=40686 RepID=A0A6N2MD81_SALVM